jgi:hypothetical protein
MSRGRARAARRVAIVVTVSCALITGGCASSPDSSQSTSVTGPSVVSTADSTTPSPSPSPSPGGTTPAPSLSPEDAVAFGPGPFDLADPAVGLDVLAGYTATVTITFVGTRDDQPLQWSQTSILHSNKGARARFLTVQAPDAVAPVRFTGQLGDARYRVESGGACTASMAEAPAEPGAIDDEILEPALLLSGVIGAEPAGADTVDGVPVDHYTFDERALGAVDPATISGELWVATTGGHLMRYQMISEGTLFALGRGVDGTLTMDYALTDIDGPFSAVLPADCPPMVDVPLLPDAADIDAHPGFLGYSTTTSALEALQFYQQALPALGWTPAAGIPIVSKEGGRISFVASGSQLSVVVSPAEAGTRVFFLQHAVPA